MRPVQAAAPSALTALSLTTRQARCCCWGFQPSSAHVFFLPQFLLPNAEHTATVAVCELPDGPDFAPAVHGFGRGHLSLQCAGLVTSLQQVYAPSSSANWPRLSSARGNSVWNAILASFCTEPLVDMSHQGCSRSRTSYRSTSRTL